MQSEADPPIDSITVASICRNSIDNRQNRSIIAILALRRRFPRCHLLGWYKSRLALTRCKFCVLESWHAFRVKPEGP